MANPSVLAADAILYSPAEPEGRLFPAGESWPGDAWSLNRGGEPVGKGATKQAMKDLIDAQDTIDSLSGQLASKDHDLAVMAADRDDATGKLSDAEQRAIEAEKAQTAAEDAARAYMTERDNARSEIQGLTDKLTAAGETIARLVGDLAAAEQLTADANAALEAARAEIAKVDGDGDGKVGGRAKKEPAA